MLAEIAEECMCLASVFFLATAIFLGGERCGDEVYGAGWPTSDGLYWLPLPGDRKPGLPSHPGCSHYAWSCSGLWATASRHCHLWHLLHPAQKGHQPYPGELSSYCVRLAKRKQWPVFVYLSICISLSVSVCLAHNEVRHSHLPATWVLLVSCSKTQVATEIYLWLRFGGRFVYCCKMATLFPSLIVHPVSIIFTSLESWVRLHTGELIWYNVKSDRHRWQRSKMQQNTDKNVQFNALDLICRFTKLALYTERHKFCQQLCCRTDNNLLWCSITYFKVFFGVILLLSTTIVCVLCFMQVIFGVMHCHGMFCVIFKCSLIICIFSVLYAGVPRRAWQIQADAERQPKNQRRYTSLYTASLKNIYLSGTQEMFAFLFWKCISLLKSIQFAI